MVIFNGVFMFPEPLPVLLLTGVERSGRVGKFSSLFLTHKIFSSSVVTPPPLPPRSVGMDSYYIMLSLVISNCVSKVQKKSLKAIIILATVIIKINIKIMITTTTM